MLRGVSRFSNQSIHRCQWSPIIAGSIETSNGWKTGREGTDVMLLEVPESFRGTWRICSHYPRHQLLCPDVQLVTKQSRHLHNKTVQFITLPSFLFQLANLLGWFSRFLLETKTQHLSSKVPEPPTFQQSSKLDQKPGGGGVAIFDGSYT